MNFTLYPIYWSAERLEGDRFDMGRLPFDIAEGVRIEDVRGRFLGGSFDLWKERIGGEAFDALGRVRLALVHRYDPRPVIVDGELLGNAPRETQSVTLVRLLAACLRLVRPMRQRVSLIHGRIQDADGSFDVGGFDVPPVELIDVPEVQKLFKLRNQDADDLRAYAPEFLRAVRGKFWKFKMAVQFYELGYFQTLDWKARYLLWCSAIESIYTSHHREHQGGLVATSRIRWFLGENTSVYAPGDLSDLLRDPGITVGRIVADLYTMRNYLAHGDRIPDLFFFDILREGFSGGVQKPEVLLEAASFIVRTSLLKILRDDLLNHFADVGPAEAYFGAQRLTRAKLSAQIAPRNPPRARPRS